MAVSVSLPNESRTVFPDATSWHIDEEGRLHVIDPNGKGNLATFKAEAWDYAQRHNDVK